MTVVNCGEDDKSGAGTLVVTVPVVVVTIAALYETTAAKRPTAPKHSKQIKLQRPTIQDAKLMEKNDAMANQFFKYNTFRLESLGDNISATSWISNAEKSNQEAQQC
ncbi:unnamed protein product [Peronospora farinosa]|uniref:Uncharacterized protein n=1 Tax=Peronospora farinosa TaxID=134698 RepID=A0AAV0SUA2_9STRA|nr:unnamed protein product [Peronospora farinosa]